MATTGIGNVDVVFTADTRRFSAAINDMGSSLAKTATAAATASREIGASLDRLSQRADESDQHFQDRAAAAASARQKTAAELGAAERAVDRYRASWQRELVAQERATQVEETAARMREQVALQLDIISRANGKLAASTDAVSGRFAAMSADVRASIDSVGAQITAVAEKAELSADGIAAGFGGLGKLLGVGLAGDFAAHMLDDLAEINVKLGDLHEKTGIAVQDLAGLRMAAQIKGLDFDTISMGLIRMAKAMGEAKEGMQEGREAFSNLGISMKEVETLSPEQMLYRIGKAFEENRSLVVDDTTALEIFGRGGKDMVPILREWGGGLQDVVKQQGALSGVTDESVAASQRWLVATTDLSTEFHAGMIPVLEDLVGLLPYIETGFHLLQAGTEIFFGTLVNDAATVVDSIHDVWNAVTQLAKLHPGSAWSDVKSVWTANQNGWDIQKANIKAESLAAWTAWNNRGASDLASRGLTGQNTPGDMDGALMKAAKQQLATMEQQHPLSQQQIIAFWKAELAKAKKGSVDYAQVNLLLGNLVQHAGSGRAQTAPTVPMLRIVGATPIERAQRDTAHTAPAQQSDDAKFQVNQFEEGIKRAQDQAQALELLQQLSAKLTAKGQLFDISSALAQGRLTKYQAVVAEAKVHEASFAAELTDLDMRLMEARSLVALPGMAPQIATLEGQRRELVLSGAEQGATDRQAIGAATVGGAAIQALNQMVAAWDDMAAQIAGILKQTVGGLNSDIVNALLTPGQNHHQVEAAFGKTLNDAAKGLLTASLQKGEAGLLGAFGLGGKVDGSSSSNALWVRWATASGSPVTGAGSEGSSSSTVAPGIFSGNELDDLLGAPTPPAGAARESGAAPSGIAGLASQVGAATKGQPGPVGIFGGLLSGFANLFGGKPPAKRTTGALGAETLGFPASTYGTTVAPDSGNELDDLTGSPSSADIPAALQRVPTLIRRYADTDASLPPTVMSLPTLLSSAGNGIISSGSSDNTDDSGMPSTVMSVPTFISPNPGPIPMDLPALLSSGSGLDSGSDGLTPMPGGSNSKIPSAPDVQPKTISQVVQGGPSPLDKGLLAALTIGTKVAFPLLFEKQPADLAGTSDALSSIYAPPPPGRDNAFSDLDPSTFAGGGRVSGPGTGTSDSIFARLSHGEFVTRASSAAKHLQLLHAINNDTLRFALGGPVGFDDGGFVSPSAAYLPAAGAGMPSRLSSEISRNASSSSRGSSGDTHQWTINIPPGNPDPAQMTAHMDRYMRTAAPQIAAMAIRANKDQQLRRAPSAH